MNLPSDDLVALSQRLWESFAGRCVRRFLLMSGIDRCIVLAAQALTALIPLLILVTTLVPSGHEDILAHTFINKFGLSGDSAAAVEQLFKTPENASSSVSVFSALLLVLSGVSFTRRLQTMYLTAWERDRMGVRSSVFAALGLAALLAEVTLIYFIRGLVRQLPGDWLWMLPLTAATGLVIWTSIPYLLMHRHVHWRRLLAAGAISSAGIAVFGVATTIYMPPLITRYSNEFGLFGITVALLGWLLSASAVIVSSTAVGAEFDASREPWVVRFKTRYGLYDPRLGPPVPAAGAEHGGLSTADVAMLARVLVNWLVLTAAVWVATAVVPGIDVPGGLVTYLGVSLLFGLVNALLGPLLHLVTLPLSVLTLGLFALVVNGLLLSVTAAVSSNLDVSGIGSAVLGALVISIVTTLLELVLRPLERRPASIIPRG
jgi:membrane protein